MTVAARWPEPEEPGPDGSAVASAAIGTATVDRPADAGDAGATRTTSDRDTGTSVEGAGGAGRLPHFPAVDGLRGLAVIAIVLFHAQLGLVQGAFFSVSTFFTLSGFLITALLLAERRSSGGVSLSRFFSRRVRRLMPAAFAALAFIVVFGIVAADVAQKRNLAGDVISALTYVANWRFLLSHRAYGDLFTAPSPVQHFWSLAIEEQFYLVFPVVAWFGLARLRIRQGTFAAVIALLVAASLALTLFGGLSHDAIYYNTFTRAAELLVGALLAALIFRPRIMRALTESRRLRPGLAIFGAVALVGMVVLWVAVPEDADWVYRGGLVAYAFVSAAVIIGAIVPYGPVHHVLRNRLFVTLGVMSYGIYLFHWPIFVWMDPSRTGLSDAQLFVPRVALTLVVAYLSYRFVETPIRRGQRIGSVRLAVVAPAVAVGLALCALVVTIRVPDAPAADFEDAAGKVRTSSIDAPAAEGPVAITPDAPFPRMAIFGDSTAVMAGRGLLAYADDTKQSYFVPGGAQLGCGIGRGGQRENVGWGGKLEHGPIPDLCNAWEQDWTASIAENEPNIAVVSIGPWEVANRQLAGDTAWRAPGDPVYDDFLREEMDTAVRTLSRDGAVVVWLTSPIIGPDVEGHDPVTAHGPGGEPARMERVNELIRELPARHPGLVQVVDLAAWIRSTGDEDRRLRPDGIHFDQKTSAEVAQRYLAGAIIDAYRADWPARVAQRTSAPTPTTGSTPTPP